MSETKRRPRAARPKLPDPADAFLAAVDAAPEDLTCRLVLADFLEESGRTLEALGWRWTVTKNRLPHYVPTGANAYVEFWRDAWNWLDVTELWEEICRGGFPPNYQDDLVSHRARLPDPILRCKPYIRAAADDARLRQVCRRDAVYKPHPTAGEALKAVAQRYAKLPEEDRLLVEAWEPPVPKPLVPEVPKAKKTRRRTEGPPA